MISSFDAIFMHSELEINVKESVTIDNVDIAIDDFTIDFDSEQFQERHCVSDDISIDEIQQIEVDDYLYAFKLPRGEVGGTNKAVPLKYVVVDSIAYFEAHNLVRWLGWKSVCAMHFMISKLVIKNNTRRISIRGVWFCLVRGPGVLVLLACLVAGMRRAADAAWRRLIPDAAFLGACRFGCGNAQPPGALRPHSHKERRHEPHLDELPRHVQASF